MLINQHIFEFLLISKVDGLVSMHCETPLCDVLHRSQSKFATVDKIRL